MPESNADGDYAPTLGAAGVVPLNLRALRQERTSYMFRHVVPIGRIFGISVDLDYSWFLIVGLLTWMLAVSYYPIEFRNWNTGELADWFCDRGPAVRERVNS